MLYFITLLCLMPDGFICLGPRMICCVSEFSSAIALRFQRTKLERSSVLALNNIAIGRKICLAMVGIEPTN